MDQAALVGIRSDWYDRLRDGGGRLLAGLRTGGLDVRAAGWVQSESDREWHLYLVSPAVEAGRAGDGYGVVESVLRSLNAPWLLLDDIKLIGPSDPLARGLLGETNHASGAGGAPVVVTGDYIGSVPIVGPAYIYPVPKPAQAPATGS